MKLPRFLRRMYHWWTQIQVKIYQWSAGKLMNRLKGAPVLLLKYIGISSGKKHVTPLIYFQDGSDYIVAASFGGAAKHPGWFRCLQETPKAEINVRGKPYPVDAIITSGEERIELWQKLQEMFPNFRIYQARTDREIPVIILRPSLCEDLSSRIKDMKKVPGTTQ